MALLQYTRNVLSTEAIARYVLHTMTAPPKPGPTLSPHPYISQKNILQVSPKKVLYLTHNIYGDEDDFQRGDYMTDLLLHGLKQVLGQSSVLDYPKRDCLYKKPSGHFTQARDVSAR